MGAFYGSILIKTEKSEEVQKALGNVAKVAGCKFLLAPPVNGWISAFPEHSGQNDQISIQIAKQLPHDIFHLLVHDDDVFAYFFYRNGQLIDRYNSGPDYFEEVSDEEKRQSRGRPELFQDLLGAPELLNKLKALLAADKYVFEQERMAKFVELFGFSNALSSYEYLQSGERHGIKNWKQFIHIPDLSAEKAAKRAEQAKIKDEKKRLQGEGVLLAEIIPPRQKTPGLPATIAWGADTSNHGLLMMWQSCHFTQRIDDKEYAAEFLSMKPPWNTPPEPLGLITNWTAHTFSMSPSAEWLAGGFAFGDWKMRVWNWRRKELAFEVTHSRSVDWVAFSPDERWLYSSGGEEFTVTSLETQQPVITVRGIAGARSAAVHPSGKFAAVNVQGALGIIDLEKKELIKKLVVNRGMETIDPFAIDPKGTLVHECLKTFLENPKVKAKLGVDEELHAAILQDPKAVEKLTTQAQAKIKSMLEKVRLRSLISFEKKEQVFDLNFSPGGDRLFIASAGMRVFDWNKLLGANGDTPAPELSVDAPRDDENDPNSRPLAYCVRFDATRDLLLSSCLAGVVQYLNVRNGQSGTLLKLPGEVTVWRIELTSDNNALCCHCSSRPSVRNLKNQFNLLQVWNYPALCKAAGLD